MFGHDSLPSKIYRYGGRAPRQGLDLFEEQALLMHRYRNALVELERTRRERTDQTLRQLCPDVLALEEQVAERLAELEGLREGLAQLRAERGVKRLPTAETAPVRACAAQLREIRALFRAARQRAFASLEVRAALARIEEDTQARLRALRADCGLYWGNYLLVEQSAQSFRKGAPPRFLRWREGQEGRIGVQLQKGLSVADALTGTDQRLRIVPTGQSRGGRRQFAEAWFRVGSEGRAPRWCVVPVVWHRPLPEGAQIKWAYLHRHPQGTLARWELSLVISQAEEWQHADAALDGACGLDIGWRLLPDGSLRVASWVGTDAATGEWRLPARDLERWFKADSLRGIRDVAFNQARSLLSGWIGVTDAATLPEWFTLATRTLAHWRRPQALYALMLVWGRQRFAGDEDIFPQLWGQTVRDGVGKPHYDGFALQERHLYNYESGMRQQAVRWRDDRYRNLIAQLRRRYHTVYLEDTDWRDLTVRPASEDARAENERARRHRFLAAPGRLSQLSRDGFAEAVPVKAAWTTQTCAFLDCGRRSAFDASAELVVRCPFCGRAEDQDQRAARNLLRWGQQGVPASGPTVDETPPPSREPQEDGAQGLAS